MKKSTVLDLCLFARVQRISRVDATRHPFVGFHAGSCHHLVITCGGFQISLSWPSWNSVRGVLDRSPLIEPLKVRGYTAREVYSWRLAEGGEVAWKVDDVLVFCSTDEWHEAIYSRARSVEEMIENEAALLFAKLTATP